MVKQLEYTIIAEDDKIQEISPGIFYNIWTFNGTVPGPTIRATEGDLIRIHFINNGLKSHTMHFHGIHPAEMDGVFEIVGGGGGQFTCEFIAGPATWKSISILSNWNRFDSFILY